MKKIILIGLGFFFMTSNQAQSLITPFAGSSFNSTQSISYSGGEAIIATLEKDNVYITEGLQQPHLNVATEAIDVPSVILNNGNTVINQKLVIGFDLHSDPLINHFIIYDPSGKLLYSKEKFRIDEFQDWWRNSFNGSYLSAGIYFYFIEYEHQDKPYFKSGTITKL
ncbi:MAG: gliding motility-associated C-terminal domain-containing protein [Bacteroidia bacterium]|nr:gliding motility-associated C-terminal domain-containing protein [Bacteroidia bacterium]